MDANWSTQPSSAGLILEAKENILIVVYYMGEQEEKDNNYWVKIHLDSPAIL